MNMRWRFNSCRAHRENVSLLASGALPEAEQAPVRDHLAHCGLCRQYYEEMSALSGEFQQWASMEPSVEAGTAFRARWMRSIQATDGSARTSLATLIGRWNESLWPSPVAWGVLAAVWICLLSVQWAMSPEPATGLEAARSPTSNSAAAVNFVERQRELAALLESLASPPAPRPEPARPRSQRAVESVTT